MQILAQYPLSAEMITPYIGRPVAAMTIDGDIEYGVIDRIHDGHLVMRPIDTLPEAAVQNIQKSLRAKAKSIPYAKAQTKAWGPGFGAYPFGWGYRNFGWGLGWWWLFPLFALTALAAFPFLW